MTIPTYETYEYTDNYGELWFVEYEYSYYSKEVTIHAVSDHDGNDMPDEERAVHDERIMSEIVERNDTDPRDEPEWSQDR